MLFVDFIKIDSNINLHINYFRLYKLLHMMILYYIYILLYANIL